MSLANAIAETIQARDLTTAEVADRLYETQDRSTFYRMLNGATKEPRLGTVSATYLIRPSISQRE